MLTTRQNELREISSEYQQLRHCVTTKRLNFAENGRVSRLIKEPNKLQMYSSLLEQNQQSVKNYFGGCIPSSLKRESEDTKLQQELFPKSFGVERFDNDCDIIVANNFFIETTKVNFAYTNTLNSNFKEFKEIKNDSAAFELLIKSKYQAYKTNFINSNNETHSYKPSIFEHITSNKTDSIDHNLLNLHEPVKHQSTLLILIMILIAMRRKYMIVSYGMSLTTSHLLVYILHKPRFLKTQKIL